MKMQENNSPKMLKSNSVFSKNSSYYIHNSVVIPSFPLHQHEFFEIDFILSGKAISHINGMPYEITKGNILFLSPADFHDFVVIGDEALSVINIAFSSSLIYSKVWNTIPIDTKIAYLEDSDFLSIKYTCELLIREYEKKCAEFDIIIKTGIEWILFWVARNSVDTVENKHNDSKNFAPVLVYIHENFTNDTINRTTAAKVMNMSPMHFSKCFHRAMGMTFQNYLLNLRLNYAMGMIKTTNLSISEVGSLSGFDSVSYFSKAFKKRFGNPPGVFRKIG